MVNPMLKELQEVDEHTIGVAWKLGKRAESTSYPRVSSLAQLTERLQKAAHAERERLLGYFAGERLQGICAYFWDPKERYAQTTLFLIERACYCDTADGFLSVLRSHLEGYELLIGVPAANQRAVSYLENRGFACVEASIDTRWRGGPLQQPRPAIGVESITEADFAEYAVFHDRYALPLEMYWHSRNVARELERFRILAVRQHDVVRAGICARTYPGGAEIVGLFTDEQNADVIEALIQSLLQRLYQEFGALNEVMYFIAEGSDLELRAAQKAGFEVHDHYRCYRRLL